jgi:hypothetical protein
MTPKDRRQAAILEYDEDATFADKPYEEGQFFIGSREYRCLTKREILLRAKVNIIDNLWTFKHSFLRRYSKSIDAINEKTWTKLAGGAYESFNVVVLSMITARALKELTYDAIEIDGLGHFINSYDGTYEQIDDFYFFRTN